MNQKNIHTSFKTKWIVIPTTILALLGMLLDSVRLFFYMISDRGNYIYTEFPNILWLFALALALLACVTLVLYAVFGHKLAKGSVFLSVVFLLLAGEHYFGTFRVRTESMWHNDGFYETIQPIFSILNNHMWVLILLALAVLVLFGGKIGRISGTIGSVVFFLFRLAVLGGYVFAFLTQINGFGVPFHTDMIFVPIGCVAWLIFYIGMIIVFAANRFSQTF